MSKIIGLVLARKNSKGIPNKNMVKLKGKPLIGHILDKAKKSKILDELFVSSDDSNILTYAFNKGVAVIQRPDYLCTDTATSIDAVKHALKFFEADAVCLLNACCPFTTRINIDNAIRLFIDEEADSVTSLVEDFSAHPSKVCNMIGKRIYPINSSYAFNTKERQLLSKIYKRNTAIYITKVETLKQGTFFGKKNYGYIMKQEKSFDINTMWDLKLCKLLMES